MKTKYEFIALIMLLFMIAGCNNAEKGSELKDKELTPQQKEPDLKKAETKKVILSTADAARSAETQFRQYLPKILKAHNAYLDSQDTFTGDFTGDGIDDIAIYFSLAPNEGGNTIVAIGLALYQNNGTTVKVIAGYEPDYLFRFDKISNGKIYVEKLEYAKRDARCCPSVKTEHVLTISGNKVY